MIERISLLLEILSFLIVLSRLHNKRLSLDIGTILFISFDIIIFQLANNYNIEQSIIISVYLVAVIYVCFCFKQKVGVSIISVIMAMVITGFLQICIALLSNKVTNLIKDDIVSGFIINTFTLIFVIILTKNIDLSGVLNFIVIKNKILKIVILSVFMTFVTCMILFKINDGLTFSEYFLLVSLVIIAYLLIQQWKNEYKITKERDLQLRMQSTYNDSFDLLLSEVRDNQHDLKNHLNVIFGLHYTCNSYNELVEKQMEYSEQILKNSKFNKLLYSCRNPVIAGFLYNKFLDINKQGMDVVYNIIIDYVNEDVIQVFDIIEILGILLDNAVEALRDQEVERQRIRADLYKEDGELIIQICNISDKVSFQEIEKFFKKGYSTKGNGRGLGLHKVMKLKEKYGGKLIVHNDEIEGENWIAFDVRIPE